MDIISAAGPIISKIEDLMVEPVGRQFRYMFCFNNFAQEFKEQKENLVSVKDRLQDAVRGAERNAEEIYKDVIKWLEDANNGIEGAKPLENEIEKNGKCFTWCPNCMRQFKLSMTLAKTSETFRKLQETSKKFTTVSCKAPPQPIEFLPSKEFMFSKSSEEAFEQIMKALKDDNVNMIGLYGMGGVGKTTLVNEVGRRAKELHLFDEVLKATVSQNLNVTGIQDQMADSLDLTFVKKSKEGRANELWQRLQGKKMLIILDDVWKDIDLKEIGIPFGDAHMGCKILLTTRLQDICSYMECQPKVFLSLLSENEAWALFKNNAGLRDEDSDLNRVAKEVARECQGLPIALVAVGKALKDKSEHEWEVASEELKKSQSRHMEKFDDRRNAYVCLKLSYDYLKNEKTKLCFLLCCLFPEDYNIPIEGLTRYAVGYGLYQDVKSIEGARKRVYMEIENLKACCMLLGTETEEYVKMHDLVRDVAIQIASSEKYGFIVKAGFGLKEWPTSNKSFEGCTVISLMGNKLTDLPEGLVCPQLKVLLLELDRGLNVPERFFEGMKAIEVLSLEGGCLSLQSLQFSTNLQSLLLRRCECKDLIWLRKLQRLQILGFMWCDSVEELPDERIPVNLIGRLKKLEELLIGSFKGWDVVGCDSTEGMNASLTERNSLSHLAVLSLTIPKVECIPRDFVFPRLLKYDIVLGNGYSKRGYPTSTGLYLGGISATSLNAKTFEQLFPTVSQIHLRDVKSLENIELPSGHGSQKDFLQRLENVEVNECGDIRTLFPAKWRQALKNLRSVKTYDCKSLEEVFEFDEAEEGINEEKELPLLSSLTTLRLSYLPELKCIWKGPTRHVSLQSFTRLELSSLDKLTFIFTPSLAQSLIHLETLEIFGCRGLKRLIRKKDDEGEIIPESLGFPKLKTLSISGCEKLEYVFPVSVSPSLQNLEEMKIHFADNLKQVFYSGEGDDIIVKSKIKDGIIDFPQLRELSLSKCSFFGPKDFAAQLPSLQCLSISCLEEWGNLLAQLRLFPTVSHIDFWRVEGLKNIVLSSDQMTTHGHGSQKDFFQRLQHVEVRKCGDIRTLFPAKWRQALKNLRSVVIKKCKSLEEVFELGEADEGSNEEKELPLLSSLTELLLSDLPELKCIWKGPIRHVSLQSLTRLELSSLDKLTFIFTPSLAQSLIHLETLEIFGCRGLKRLIRKKDDEGEIIPESLGFPKLKTLSISGCEKLEYVFPVSVSPSLQNLKKMKIHFADNLKQVFYSEEGDDIIVKSKIKDGIIDFPQLRELSLSKCSFFGPKDFAAQLPSLQCLSISGLEEWGNLLAQLRGFMNLKGISIENLEGVQDLMQVGYLVTNRRGGHELSLVSLEALHLNLLPDLRCIWKGLVPSNLTTLKVKKCDRLTHVFTINIIASLVQLEVLKISNCEELEQIIAKDNDDENDQILSGSDLQSSCLPKLEGVQDLMQVGCLVTNRRCGHELSLVSLETLHLNLLPDLRCIWKGLVPSNLTTLKVKKCDRLTHVFTINIIASLGQLEVLKISNCEELEQIIAKDNDDENDQILSGSDLQSSCFPNLCRFKIRGCNKLKSLFPVAMASGLKRLQSLEVRESSQLLRVFGQDNHASPANIEKEMVLPGLQLLILEKLPSIVCFSHGCYDFLFPRLVMLLVRQCPKLTTRFATTSNGSMSAQSEVSQVVEDSSTGCSVPTTTSRMCTRNNGWWDEVEEEEEEKDEDGGGHDN